MFSKKNYLNRRADLKRNFNSGLLLFIGNTDTSYNYKSNIYRFRQDSSFLYLFGIDKPNVAAILDIDNDKEIIFGNDIDIDDIVWTGPVESMREIAAKAGISDVRTYESLNSYVTNALQKGQVIHFLPPYRAEIVQHLTELLGKPVKEIASHKSQQLINAMVKLRSVKEPEEIAEIEKMLDVAHDMHVSAMAMAKTGISEREIAGKMEGVCLSKAYAPSFPIICSVRGEVLHNTTYNNVLKTGQILLCDAGAESLEHYASDITRVAAVDGSFSTFQEEIFQIVLQANKKVQELAKPGVLYKDIHLEAARVIASGLKPLGMMQGDVNEIVQAGAHALFFPHGIGHMLGLDVHDMENYGENNVGYDHEIQRSEQFGLAFLRMGRRLQEGFVVTDEPGIYFIPELVQIWEKENKFREFINYNEVKKHLDFGGIRIEDNLLITRDGCKVLGKPIPYKL